MGAHSNGKLLLLLVTVALVSLVLSAPPAPKVPYGLRADWQASPALGVSIQPVFSWVVPAGCGQKEDMQTGYRIKIYTDTDPQHLVSDSGRIMRNTSVGVPYNGSLLQRGSSYHWTVEVTTSGGCTSPPSAQALFITECAWDKSARWIGAGRNTSTFNLLRKVVEAPARPKVARIVGYISAQNSWSGMLMNYKLWINGKLVSVGPGRGFPQLLCH